MSDRSVRNPGPESEPDLMSAEKLSEQEVGVLFASVGNHENKALLLGAMEPGELYSAAGLRELFIEIQGVVPEWEPGRKLVRDYCEISMAPVDLVEQQVIDAKRGEMGYRKTAYGQAVGDALAGHLLDWSRRYPQLGLDILGRSNSRWGESPVDSTRPTARRLQVIRAIIGEPEPPQPSVLARDLDCSASSITGHLNALVETDLVKYRSVDGGEAYTRFRYQGSPESELPPTNELRLQREIAADLAETATPGAEVDLEAMMERLQQRYPQWREGNFRRRVSAVMTNLTRIGIAEPIGFQNIRKAELQIDPDQRATLSEIVAIADGVVSLDRHFLVDGHHKLHAILADPERVCGLMKKARRRSRAVNRFEPIVVQEKIRQVLRGHEGRLTDEIVNVLQEQGMPVSPHIVGRTLRAMEGEGSIAGEKTQGPKKRWSLREGPD